MLLAGCSAPSPRGNLAQLFPQRPQPLDLSYTVESRRLHYIEVPGPAAVRILFIHGSPGHWQDMAILLGERSLRARGTLIAMDRPGWSAEDGGDVLPELQAQERFLQPLLKGPGAPALLVGYSYGGALAALLALDFPKQVRGVVLVAPAIDPVVEQPRWYNRSTGWWIVRALTPARFAWSNQELLPLANEVEKLQPRWRSLHVPMTVIQGEKDDQVDPQTAAFVEHEMPPRLVRVIRIPDADHYVIWRQPQLVVDAIRDLLDRTQSTLAGAANAG